MINGAETWFALIAPPTAHAFEADSAATPSSRPAPMPAGGRLGQCPARWAAVVVRRVSRGLSKMAGAGTLPGGRVRGLRESASHGPLDGVPLRAVRSTAAGSAAWSTMAATKPAR
jgi:hypothetical protein